MYMYNYTYVITKMSDNDTNYQRNTERLQEQAWNCYHQQVGQEKAKEYYENNEERWSENYPMKKRI